MKVLILYDGPASLGAMFGGYFDFYTKNAFQTEVMNLSSGSIHPEAKQVMKEDGIAINAYKSDLKKDLSIADYAVIISINNAFAVYKRFLNHTQKVIEFQAPDPIKGTDDELLKNFRKVREYLKKEAIKITGSLSIRT